MISRRKFLRNSGLAAAGLAVPHSSPLHARPQAGTEVGRVKITDVKTAVIELKYNTTLVKVTTDDGLYGLGEAFPKVDVVGHLNDLKRKIIGKDPLQVEFLSQMLMDEYVSRGSRSGAYAGAIGGIETALWDLAGKILNVPVYVLLGGAYRDKILIYHDCGSPKGADPQAWLEEAQKSIDYGFRALKFSFGRFTGDKWNRYFQSQDMKKFVAILETIRKGIGSDIPVGIDFHWKYNTREAMKFAQMVESLDIWFIEDPIPPENADAFARLTASSPVPIATGENLYTRHQFRPFIEKQACDIVQPDAQKCGGLLEMKRIADWADMYNLNMLCHNLCTPLGTIASGHACMAIKNFLSLESDSVDLPYWQDIILRDGPVYRDGYLHIPDKPGIGVELNEDVCRAHLAAGTGYFE